MKESLREYICSAMQDCMGLEGSRLSQVRDDLKRRYLGHGYEADPERRERGLSTYVDRTVMETVEWAKPCLLRLFSHQDVLRFEPSSPEQERSAEDASAFINHFLFSQNIFMLVHDVLADGLYQRLGWCLAHMPVTRERRIRRFSGLSREEAQALLCSEEFAPALSAAAPDFFDQSNSKAAPSSSSSSSTSSISSTSSPALPSFKKDKGRPEVRVTRRETAQGPVFDITLRRFVESRELRLDPVPSEQVIVSGDARDVESARFVAFWQIRTASDLRKDGWDEDIIATLPPYESGRAMPEARTGRAVNGSADSGSTLVQGAGFAVPAGREFKVYEAWFDFDIDGDGVAEKVKAVFAGDAPHCVVMGWEEWPMYRAPLFAACSVPMPHQVAGLCVADLVSDVQDLRTEVTRQFLDSLALANQGELVVNEGRLDGSVEFDSLLARGVGAVHRIKGDASITPLPVATSSAEALSGLQMCEGLAERRTGISSRTQSLSGASLPQTATAASIVEEAVNQRVELVARVYSETFFKPLGRYLLHLIHSCRDKELEFRLFGRFMALDPFEWNPDMRIAVTAGMGAANRRKQAEVYSKILDIQQKFIAALGTDSPVGLERVVYTCHKLAETCGLEAPERFFGSEEQARRAEANFRARRQAESEARSRMLKEAEAARLQQFKAQMRIREEEKEEEAGLAARKQAFKEAEARAKLSLEARKLEVRERAGVRG